MKKVLSGLLVLVALFALGCDEIADKLEDLTGEASLETPCGRFCHKCDTCKDEMEGMLIDIVTGLCEVSGKSVACEQACDMGSSFGDAVGLNIKANVEATESKLPEGKTIMDLGDEEDQCTDFAIAMTSGEDPESLCFKVCSKCVSCADEVGVGSAVEWCSKENGLVCMEACAQVESTVQTANDLMEDNLQKDITELNCTEFDENFSEVM